MVTEEAGAPGRLRRIGLISDTHGVLDPRVSFTFAAEKVEAIVHAGDIGADHVLYELEQIAPVMAVLGNCDREIPGWDLGRIANTHLCGVRVLAIHDLCDLGPIPEWADVVVCGHTHRPRNEWHGRKLVVNPGSASQRRSQRSRSVGILEVGEDVEPRARIIELDDV